MQIIGHIASLGRFENNGLGAFQRHSLLHLTFADPIDVRRDAESLRVTYRVERVQILQFRQIAPADFVEEKFRRRNDRGQFPKRRQGIMQNRSFERRQRFVRFATIGK